MKTIILIITIFFIMGCKPECPCKDGRFYINFTQNKNWTRDHIEIDSGYIINPLHAVYFIDGLEIDVYGDDIIINKCDCSRYK